MAFLFNFLFRKRHSSKDLLLVNYTKVEEDEVADDRDIPNAIDGSMMAYTNSELVAFVEQEEVPASSEAQPIQPSGGTLIEINESADSVEVEEIDKAQYAGIGTSAPKNVGVGGSKVKLNAPLDAETQEAIMESLNRSYFPVMVRDHHPEAPPVESFTPFFPPHTRPRNFSAIYVPTFE